METAPLEMLVCVCCVGLHCAPMIAFGVSLLMPLRLLAGFLKAYRSFLPLRDEHAVVAPLGG